MDRVCCPFKKLVGLPFHFPGFKGGSTRNQNIKRRPWPPSACPRPEVQEGSARSLDHGLGWMAGVEGAAAWRWGRSAILDILKMSFLVYKKKKRPRSNCEKTSACSREGSQLDSQCFSCKQFLFLVKSISSNSSGQLGILCPKHGWPLFGCPRQAHVIAFLGCVCVRGRVKAWFPLCASKPSLYI